MSQPIPQFQTLPGLIPKCAACTHDDHNVVMLCWFHAKAPEMLTIIQQFIKDADFDAGKHGRMPRNPTVSGYAVENARALLREIEEG